MKQLFTYFSLAYLISWILWLPLYAPAFGVFELPVVPFQHGIGGLGPLIAAFVTSGIFGGKSGIARLFKKCIQLRPLLYLAIALFSPFFLLLFAALLNFWANKHSFQLENITASHEFPQFSAITFFVYNLLFFGFGEEVGWRGFALPQLQSKYKALTASIILTIFWALWHWPLFFYKPGYLNMDVPEIVGWLFSLLTGSILLTWLFNSSKGSVLICAVFHATIDIAFTADVADKQIVNYTGFLITMWGVVTIIVFKAVNLSRSERQQSILEET